MRSAIRLFLAYVAVSVVLGLVWAVSSYPDLPATAIEWMTIFALALPLQLAMEFVGERLWNNKATRFVEGKTAAQSFSLLRIAYGVLLMLVLIGLLFGAAYAWRTLPALMR